MKLNIILLCGKKGSGKTTYANYLQQLAQNAYIFSYATPLKQLLNNYRNGIDIYDKKEIYRTDMQTLGDAIRGWDKDFFVKKMIGEILNTIKYCDNSTTIIIDDLRYPNEFFSLFDCFNTKDTNWDVQWSVIYCHSRGLESTDTHPSETSVDKLFEDIKQKAPFLDTPVFTSVYAWDK